ncbi:MAG: hypothetical protein PHY47_00070 [Lachnospiraceae bacterium]|nr:hypothetical protein [Lachnospiraceae bacterium]
MFYHSVQPYQVEEAYRIIYNNEQETHDNLIAINANINLMAHELNSVKNTLKEGEDFTKISAIDNKDITFHYIVRGKEKDISLSTIAGLLEDYEDKIRNLEERIASLEFYIKEAT